MCIRLIRDNIPTLRFSDFKSNVVELFESLLSVVRDAGDPVSASKNSDVVSPRFDDGEYIAMVGIIKSQSRSNVKAPCKTNAISAAALSSAVVAS